MRFKFITITILFFLALTGFAQKTHDLKITIGNGKDTLQSKTYFVGYDINRRWVVDSVTAKATILLKLSDTLPKGLYNVVLYTNLKDVNDKYQRMTFDVILTGEDISFNVEITENKSLGEVRAAGGENLIYNNHFRTHQRLDKKIQALEGALLQYPRDDAFYNQLQEQLKKVQQERVDFMKQPCDAKQYPYACAYLSAVKASEKKQIEAVDFSDAKIKNSPFIPGIVWSYLDELNTDTLLAPKIKTEKLKERLDKVMIATGKDSQVQGEMLQEIVKYYEVNGSNDIALYLNQKYVLPVAKADVAQKIEAKNQTLASLQVGKPAPDIELSVMGFKQKLYDIEGKYVLLLFWDTDCPHCQAEAGKLIDFYHQHKSEGLEIVALALNESEKVWLNYVSEHNLDWLNFLDPDGWRSKAVREYNIQSTPSMFLLDKNKVIVSMVKDVDELKGLTF